MRKKGTSILWCVWIETWHDLVMPKLRFKVGHEGKMLQKSYKLQEFNNNKKQNETYMHLLCVWYIVLAASSALQNGFWVQTTCFGPQSLLSGFDSVHWDPQSLINIMLKLHPFFLQLVPISVLGKKQKHKTTVLCRCLQLSVLPGCVLCFSRRLLFKRNQYF